MLRDYQQTGITKLRFSLGSGNKRVIFYLATGGGKSVVATAIVESALSKGKRVAFLVNRAGLVHQFSGHLTRAGIRHGILQSSNTHSLDAPVVVGTIQTAARRGLPPVDLAIIDEAHAVPGSKDYRNLIFRFNNIPWIGLTATPFSQGMAKPHDELHGEPLFQDIVVAATIQQLIREGFLVDCEIFAPTEPDLAGVRVQKNSFGETDYSESDLGRAVDKPDLIGDIVRHWRQLAKGKQTVCFATNIAHSKHIVDQFLAAGIKAEHIDGYMTDEERAPIAQRFKDGETTVLSNVAVLREGWDVPACEAMILARPTKSLIAWVQMVGRVLRPHEGKTIALVLDHSGTVHNLGYPTDDLPLRLCDGTKSAGEGRKIEKPKDRKCPKCSFIKKTHVCPKCGFKPETQNKIISEEGELKAVSRANKASKADKQAFYSEILWYTQQKGYKPGFAAHQYRQRFGVWPRGLREAPIPTSQDTLNWIKHRAIAHAKRREKTNANA